MPTEPTSGTDSRSSGPSSATVLKGMRTELIQVSHMLLNMAKVAKHEEEDHYKRAHYATERQTALLEAADGVHARILGIETELCYEVGMNYVPPKLKGGDH